MGAGLDFWRRWDCTSPALKLFVCLFLSLLPTPRDLFTLHFCGTGEDVKYKLPECGSVGEVLKGELNLSWRCRRQAGDQQV